MLELPEGTSLQLRIEGEGTGYRLKVIGSASLPGVRRAHMRELDSRDYPDEHALWRGIVEYANYRLADLAP